MDTVIGNLHASIAHAVNFEKILTRHFLECVGVSIENDCIGVKCILLHRPGLFAAKNQDVLLIDGQHESVMSWRRVIDRKALPLLSRNL